MSAQEDFEQAKNEAIDMAQQLVDFAKTHGWMVQRAPKANKKFAFTTLFRDIGVEREELRAFYAIDPDADDDQVTHVAEDGTQTVLDPDSGQVRGVVSRPLTPATASDDIEKTPEKSDSKAPVEPVPPTSAAHTGTDTGSAAHTGPLTGDAAHQYDVDMETQQGIQDDLDAYDAAHPETDPNRDHSEVPPTGTTVVEDFKIVPPADEADVVAEAKLHAEAAAKAAVKGEHPVMSQQDTYGAVRHQQVNPHRNWSAEASVLTSDEILSRLGVNRKTNNTVEVVWLNSLSGTLDRAVVAGGAAKYPPHITPSNFDPDEHGEDLRILHFLEVNGGFRSVAVARIRKIGR